MKINELTNTKLDQYTKAANADYDKAKEQGDSKRMFKRGLNLMKASGKKISNDVKAMQKARGVAEASWINGKKQDDKELVWKQTGMSYEKAVEKYGKEHVRLGAKNKLGQQTVEVHVPLVAEGSLDDIEDTKQLKTAIALAKSQKAIRQAKHGKDQKFYSDGTPVTPKEVARRAAERKAKKQGVAEGMFGISAKEKGAIMNLTSKLSDIPNMWDHKAQTFTNLGKAELEKALNYNPKYIKYALNLTYKDYEADLDEGKFDPINDDDFYEYNVDTKEIVGHISGKHPEARRFNTGMMKREWPGRDDKHKFIRGINAKYLNK